MWVLTFYGENLAGANQLPNPCGPRPLWLLPRAVILGGGGRALPLLPWPPSPSWLALMTRFFNQRENPAFSGMPQGPRAVRAGELAWGVLQALCPLRSGCPGLRGRCRHPAKGTRWPGSSSVAQREDPPERRSGRIRVGRDPCRDFSSRLSRLCVPCFPGARVVLAAPFSPAFVQGWQLVGGHAEGSRQQLTRHRGVGAGTGVGSLLGALLQGWKERAASSRDGLVPHAGFCP